MVVRLRGLGLILVCRLAVLLELREPLAPRLLRLLLGFLAWLMRCEVGKGLREDEES